MRNLIMTAVAVTFLMIVPAKAEEQIVRQLPGNVTIVTDPDRDARGIRIYNDDDSLLYRTLVAPHARDRDLAVRNSASLDDVNSICGGTTKVSERNRCIRDVIEQREKLNKRYNN